MSLRKGLLSTIVGVLSLGIATANATTITQFGTNVSFTYDDSTLFGTGVVVGNSISFKPTDFIASSLDGAAVTPASVGGTAFLTETLNITVDSMGGFLMEEFFLSEDGDYKLKSVAPEPDASVTAEAFFTVESTTKNCPIFACDETKIFTAGALADTGGALALWALGGSIDLDDTAGWGSDTGVIITLQNNLTAVTNDNGEIAFIQKKDGDIGIVVNPVPVPAAVWLFGSGLLGLVGVARRKAA